MAKAVGISRTIKMPWIKKTMELINDGADEKTIMNELDEYLAFEIKDKTNRGKVRSILMNVWVRENECSSTVRESAIVLINKYSEQAVAVHWCLMLMAYPVFKDLCKLVGKMSEFQDEFTLKQMKAKLFDEWGETTTLFHTVDKLAATLVNIGALKRVKSGMYAVEKTRIINPEILKLMAYTTIRISDSGYHTFEDINQSSLMFPFDYIIDRDLILQDDRFTVSNFGGEATVTVR